MPNRISLASGPDIRVDSFPSALPQEGGHGASKIADAMGTLGLEPRLAGLDRQRAHTMPPRHAVLRWPNRDESQGTLTGSVSSGLTFHPSAVNGPLAERKAIFADVDIDDLIANFLKNLGGGAPPNLNGISPRSIEVLPSPEPEMSDLPRVRPKLLDTVPGVGQDVLTHLADVASGFAGSTSDRVWQRLPSILTAVLASIEGGCEDPVAVRRAAEALKRKSNLGVLEQMKVLAEGTPGEYWFAKSYTCIPDAEDHQVLQSLNEGDHLLLRVKQQSTDGAHAMAVSATRLGGETVRLSVFNSNGWDIVSAPYSPAICKTMSMTDAVAAVQTLGGGGRFGPAAGLPQPCLENWGNPGAGAPLLSWLSNAGPRESMPLPSGQRMTPQKSGDCAIEVEFAWLASVLPAADYKLAKAHVLNVLAQAAQTAGRSEHQLQRLQDRITTSLSGYAVSPPREGVGAPTSDSAV